ncbi:MAG TPA: acyl-ACP desaturase [Acidimicrobiales bacterium]|nr:acyl-ACP desaturase [Acidimicrobiales bacterium]
MDDQTILDALAGTAESLFERHLEKTKEWFPHELVPWGRGRDFVPGEAWNPDEFPLPGPVRSALFVNLLTEDNLPYYFHAVSRLFSEDGVWGAWNRRWTAEEHRHSIVIRDWMTVTRALDPVELERARMGQVSVGMPGAANISGICEGVVYVTLQELATRISHRNTGRLLGDQPGFDIMARVAADENLHFLFYRDLATAAFEVDPSGMVLAVERQVRGFEMPGTGIPDFGVHAGAIAAAGIYDFGIHHSQILVPVVLRQWQLESIEGLTPEAEAARGRTVRHINRIERVGRRLAARREEQLAGSGARSG